MSLRLRLFIAMAVVAGTSVLVTALLTRGGVRRVVEAYVVGAPAAPSAEDAAAIDGLRQALIDQGSSPGGLAGAGVELRRFVAETGRGVVLTDGNGALLAAVGTEGDGELRVTGFDPAGVVSVEWGNGPGTDRRIRGGVPLRDDDGALLGVLLVLPTKDFDSLAEALGPQGAIDRRIATSAAVAIGLALLAALLVARHVADPVARLAVATRRLAAGDRSPRIASDRSDEVGQLVSAFNHLADSLETSEGLRRRLVADVAHELRTPLAALQGRIEAMQDGLDALDAQGLEALHSDVAHLTALVAELQDLALAEAGQLRLEPVALELASEARQAARALGLDPAAGAGAAGDGGLPALDLSGGPAHVFADPQRLRQILTNLLSNAIHHAAAQTIHVTVAERGARGVIIVEDDGVGIAPEALPHIFDRLYQADTLGRSRSGVGLGLAITRELVRIHGGSIEVASEVGAGTRFTVELPRGG